MRKFTLFLLSCCSFVLIFSACKSTDSNDTYADSSTSNVAQSADEDVSSTQDDVTQKESSTIELKNAGEYNYVNAGSGAYVMEQLYPNSSTISYIDYVSCMKTPLCSTPGCTHQSDSCPSYIAQKGYFPPRILWVGRYLLVARESGSENGPGMIERRNPDGTNPVELYQFDSSDYITGTYLYDDTSLYYTYVEILLDGTQKKTLESLELETGDRKSLIELDDTAYIVGGFGNKVLIQDSDYDTSLTTFYLLDLNTLQKSECLSTNTQNELAAVVDDGIVVANQTNSLLRWLPISEKGEIGSEKDISLSLPDTAQAVIPYNLFPGYIELDVSCDNKVVNYTLDLNNETQTESQMILGEQRILYPIVGEFEDKLCVVYDIETRSFDVYSEDGTRQTAEYVSSIFGMMKKNDFLNSVKTITAIP